MPKFEQKQEVKQFVDEDITCDQEVHIDTDDLDGWLFHITVNKFH